MRASNGRLLCYWRYPTIKKAAEIIESLTKAQYQARFLRARFGGRRLLGYLGLLHLMSPPVFDPCP